jgi:hypothetical protein
VTSSKDRLIEAYFVGLTILGILGSLEKNRKVEYHTAQGSQGKKDSSRMTQTKLVKFSSKNLSNVNKPIRLIKIMRDCYNWYFIIKRLVEMTSSSF